MNKERRFPNILIFAATAFTTVSYGIALDAFLMQQGLSGRATLYLSNLLMGTAAGAWVVQRRLLQKHKNRALKERIEFLSEMNQHIRSVLTSLSLYGKHSGDAQAEVPQAARYPDGQIRFERRRYVEYQMLLLRPEIVAFEDELASWLRTPHGRFAQYYAEKLWDWIPEIYRTEDGLAEIVKSLPTIRVKVVEWVVVPVPVTVIG